MKEKLWTQLLPAGLALLGCLVFAFWWLGGSGSALQERGPGADRKEDGVGAGGAPKKWEGKLVQGSGIVPTNLSGVWPGFRGPDRNGISPETVPLARNWPEGGPKVLWRIDVGEGFAAPAIWQGRVFITDYDQQARADALRCLSLADGQEIWRYTYPANVKRSHGMSRTIPAVTGKYVVSLGPKCQVICVNTESGELYWQMNLVREFNVEVPPWYAGQCPLVEGERLILGTGGDVLLVALDCATGQVLWRSPNPWRWQMTHSSLTPVEFNGRRMYVYCASGGVVGVAADSGEILWSTPDWKISIANIPAPVSVGNGRIFLCGGYNAGSMMIQLRDEGGKIGVETLFKLKPSVFGSEQHTPILYQNHLFGVRPKPSAQLVCLDLDGKIIWESGAANKFGSGPYLIAQDLLYVMDDDGLLTLAEASTSGFRKLAQAKALEGPDAWGPMALADGRLILRDLYRMVCLDVATQGTITAVSRR